MSSIVQQIERIVSPSEVVAWNGLDPFLRKQIAQAVLPEATVDCVIYPSTLEKLAEVITCAHLDRWQLLPCGSGSKLHWGGLAEGVQAVVSTAKLDRLIEHASGDLTVTAEAGMRFVELQNQLAAAGQFLAIDPAYRDRATLGGIVATADTGALRQRYGGIRDMLIGVSFVRADGKIAKAGGRVVKNVAGYDLMKLLTGSYGTLGILSQLTFRIYPLPAQSQTIVLTGEPETIAKVTAALLATGFTPTAIDLLTPAAVKTLAIGIGMGLAVRFQGIDVSVVQQINQVMQLGQNLGLAATPLTEADEGHLWQQLQERIEIQLSDRTITCKIGVEPFQAIETLNQIDAVTSSSGLGMIHAGSGLGTIRFPILSIDTVLKLRQICQKGGGFLTVLAAPLELKQQIDIWGYPGNALEVMQRLKTQFDPENRLSPHRFVGKI